MFHGFRPRSATTTPRRWSPGALLAALLSLTLLAVACGGGGGNDETPGAAPDKRPDTSTEAAAPAAPAPDSAAPAATPAPVAGNPAPQALPPSPAAGAPAPASQPKASPKTDKPVPATKSGSATATPSPSSSPAPAGSSGSAPATATSPAPAATAPAPAPAEGNGGATDVGVSDTEVKFGSISSVSAPLGNIAATPMTTATIAAMRAVNDGGGIYGRKLRLIDCDDGNDIARFRACYRKLVHQEKIFALTTGWSFGNGEAHADLARDRIPWFGAGGFYQSEWEDPWMYPLHSSTRHEARMIAKWTLEVLKPKTAGILYLNTPEQKIARDALKKDLEAGGVKVVRELSQELDTADESANVLAMRAADPEVVLHVSFVPPMAKWMIDAGQQQYWPPKGVFGNHFLAESLGEIVGDWPKNRMWTITSFKIWGDDYLATVHKYAPHMRKLHHHFTQLTFSAVKLISHAMRELGPNLTREGLRKVLESKRWDLGPGIGQSVFWGPGGEKQKGMGIQCEYVYRFNSPDTGSLNVWVPEEKQFQICP